MQRIVALVMLLVLGFVVAGGASAKKTIVRAGTVTRPAQNVAIVGGTGAITVTGTVTLPDVEPGTPIACKGGPRVKVPAGAGGVNATRASFTAASGPSPSTSLELSRSANGTVTVSCSRK